MEASGKLNTSIVEIVKERDKTLRWRLISFGLAKGLEEVGKLVIEKKMENIFLEDIQLILKWIQEENVDSLYKFFCDEGEIE